MSLLDELVVIMRPVTVNLAQGIRVMDTHVEQLIDLIQKYDAKEFGAKGDDDAVAFNTAVTATPAGAAPEVPQTEPATKPDTQELPTLPASEPSQPFTQTLASLTPKSGDA